MKQIFSSLLKLTISDVLISVQQTLFMEIFRLAVFTGMAICFQSVKNRHRPLTAPLNLCPIYLKLLVDVQYN